ncbi:MAG: helix-turn-helix domain-containing protein [Ruminococcaceae bacterium]|nr:helix-turn-helix domain-containing protein [Oscillospiraceae bacterium]
MYEDVKQLDSKDYFKDGEQVYIHIGDEREENVGVMHKHNFIEIAYVISGSAHHFMDNINYEVRKGDLVIVNYGVPHAFVPIKDTEEDFSTYDLLFTTDFFEITSIDSYDFSALASSYLFYSLFADGEPLNHSLNLIRSGAKDFGELFRKIYDEYIGRQSGFMNMIRAYLIQIITQIFREIDHKTDVTSTNEQKSVVNKAIDYMKQNYNTPINLDNLVADIFLSKDYFRQLFKTTTGMSVTDFIQRTRIEEACKLLATTNRSVFDIAGNCGFMDVKFFYKTFKKITGKTPSEFRKEKEGEVLDHDNNR